MNINNLEIGTLRQLAETVLYLQKLYPADTPVRGCIYRDLAGVNSKLTDVIGGYVLEERSCYISNSDEYAPKQCRCLNKDCHCDNLPPNTTTIIFGE